jgi:hypothetical protein
MPRTEHRQASQATTRASDIYRASTKSTQADGNATNRIDATGGNRGLWRQEVPLELEAESSVVLNHDAALILARIIRAHLSRSGQGPSSSSSARRKTSRTTRNWTT